MAKGKQSTPGTPAVASKWTPEQSATYRAGNLAENATMLQVGELHAVLGGLPQIGKLTASLHPGSFEAGSIAPVIEDKDWAEAEVPVDEPLFFHFSTQFGNQNPQNAGLLLKAFAGGWKAGVAALLAGAEMDSGNPLNNFFSMPTVQAEVAQLAADFYRDAVEAGKEHAALLPNNNVGEDGKPLGPEKPFDPFASQQVKQDNT